MTQDLDRLVRERDIERRRAAHILDQVRHAPSGLDAAFISEYRAHLARADRLDERLVRRARPVT